MDHKALAEKCLASVDEDSEPSLCLLAEGCLHALLALLDGLDVIVHELKQIR